MAWCEVYEIRAPRLPYEFHLHGLSDLQIGSESCSLKTIRSRIEEICSDPVDSGVVIAGDIEDEDRPSTRAIRRAAFSDREEVVTRDAEKHMACLDKEVIPRLLPLQKTRYGIMGILAGHHWTQLSSVLNSVQYICAQLGQLSKKKVPYLGEMSSFMDFRFSIANDNTALRRIIHVQHGEGGGQGKTSSLLKLNRAFESFEADAYIRAHDCQIVASKFDRLYVKNGARDAIPDILSRTVAVMNLGSATQGYGVTRGRPSYIESGMMRPTTMGWGTLAIKVRRAHAWEDEKKAPRVDMKIVI